MQYTLEELEEKTPDELNSIMRAEIQGGIGDAELIRNIFLAIDHNALSKYDICHIVEYGDIDSLEVLFANGYVVIPEHIDIVCKKINPDVLKILLKAGGDPDQEYDINSPLMVLVQYSSEHSQKNFERCADLLLKCGADINHKRADFKYTALHYAVISKKTYAIKYLLDNGADISVEDATADTPWDLAVNTIRKEFPKLEPKSV